MNYELEIRVIGVDQGRIREHGTLESTWIVPYRLSSKPDESWVRNFNEIFKKNVNIEKKKAHVVGDFIEVNLSSSDDQQKVLDLLKQDIKDTNAACQAIYEHKMKMQDDLKALQKTHANIIQKIKDDAENLKF